MSRLSKYLSLSILIVFVLACSTVTQPLKDAQDVAGTVQSFATALPVETLKAFASQVPVETLEALPSLVPTIEAISTDIAQYLNPQGTPVDIWKEIPIMPEATAGQEFNDFTYSFRISVTTKEVEVFYNDKLKALGWSQFNVPIGPDSTMLFQKDSDFLNITVIPGDSSVVILLTLV